MAIKTSSYLGSIAYTLASALLLIVALSTVAQGQEICRNEGFGLASGTVACDGSAAPVTAQASVETSARLTLDDVFGGGAGGLLIDFGTVDATCSNTPLAGVTCANVVNDAVWYGDITLEVRLSGLGASTAKLTGVRPAAGSIPAGQLYDGPSGAQPTVAYTISPTAAIDLSTGLSDGRTNVIRSIGLEVKAADAAATWSGQIVYSLVIE